MTVKLIIETVDNGLILTDEVDGDLNSKSVFSYSVGEYECIVDILNSVKECLGYCGSKHDEQRIFVRLEKQNGGEE